MSGAHAHLIFNHIPVIGFPIALLVALFGRWRKNVEICEIGSWLTLAVSLLAMPAYFTGEGAEETVEHFSSISAPHIEPHEDAALGALISMQIAGVMAFAALLYLRKRRQPAKIFWRVFFIVSAVAAVLMIRAAYLGGQIHHEEIRSGIAVHLSYNA